MNTAYRKLAYESATLKALVRLAKEEFLPSEGSEEPTRQILCETLPVKDSKVPEDDVHDVILNLERVIRAKELEMSKYKFVATETDYEQEWTQGPTQKTAQASPRNSGGQAPGGHGKQGKGRGGQGGSKAPTP